MHINEAERKLQEYRTKKKRAELLDHYKAEMKHVFTKIVIVIKKPKPEESGEKTEAAQKLLLDLSNLSAPDIKSDGDSTDGHGSDAEESAESAPFTVYDYLQYLLWFLLWVTMYAIFIQIAFGTVYFALSLLVGMYLNTRTKPKKRHEVSAYSVFNKNCESIDGTLDAEKLTREMFGVYK